MIVHVVEFSRGSFQRDLSILELLLISLTFSHLLLKRLGRIFILFHPFRVLLFQIVIDLFSTSHF